MGLTERHWFENEDVPENYEWALEDVVYNSRATEKGDELGMTKEEAHHYIDNLKWLKGYDNTVIGGKTVCEILDEINTLLEGQEAQGWISVEDRLPKENTAVNVVWVNHNPASYYAHIKDKPFTATAVYYDRNWYWWDDTIEDIISEYGGRAPIAGMIDLDIEVTHWQYLPKPPKEENDENHV